jgi:hypothetical protein
MSNERKSAYELDTLALPPLNMVLVTHENERLNAAKPAAPRVVLPKKRTGRQIVVRLIEYFEEDR